MNDTPGCRLAVLSGLALAAALGLWWLGSTRLALEHGADAARSSADTLQAAWLMRGLVLPLLALRVGALHGWRTGAAGCLALVVCAWPLVVLAWSASAAPLSQLATIECLLLAAAVALPLLGRGLRRVMRRAELAELVATAAGLALAASAWLTRSAWSLPLG